VRTSEQSQASIKEETELGRSWILVFFFGAGGKENPNYVLVSNLNLTCKDFDSSIYILNHFGSKNII
jgi:hypothetical protein